MGDSVHVFTTFIQELQKLREVPDLERATELLEWLQDGGLTSHKPYIDAFLDEAARAGSAGAFPPAPAFTNAIDRLATLADNIQSLTTHPNGPYAQELRGRFDDYLETYTDDLAKFLRTIIWHQSPPSTCLANLIGPWRPVRMIAEGSEGEVWELCDAKVCSAVMKRSIVAPSPNAPPRQRSPPPAGP